MLPAQTKRIKINRLILVTVAKVNKRVSAAKTSEEKTLEKLMGKK